MANRDGVIQGATLLSKSFSGLDEREVWHVTAEWTEAVTASADVARLLDVGAALSDRAADGKTRTVRWAAPFHAGREVADDDPAYFIGTNGYALAVSSDDLSGDLGTATTAADRTAATGVGIIVACDVS